MYYSFVEKLLIGFCQIAMSLEIKDIRFAGVNWLTFLSAAFLGFLVMVLSQASALLGILPIEVTDKSFGLIKIMGVAWVLVFHTWAERVVKKIKIPDSNEHKPFAAKFFLVTLAMIGLGLYLTYLVTKL